MMNAAEWRYVPFSEERLVTRLIKSRSKLECLKGNDDILCVLIDLYR